MRLRRRAPRAALSVAALLLALAGLEAGLRALPRLVEPARAVSLRVLCLGESTTAPTYGVDVSWPRQLQLLLDRRYGAGKAIVINEGRRSSNSSVILARLPGLLDLYHPQIIVAMTGQNDGEWFAQAPAGQLARLLAGLRLVRLARGLFHEPWADLRDESWEDPSWIKAKGEAAFFLRESRSDRAWRSLEPLLRSDPGSARADDASELFLQFGDRSILGRLARLSPAPAGGEPRYWSRVDSLESQRRYPEEDALALRESRRFPGELSPRLLSAVALRRRDPAAALAELEAIARVAPPGWPLRERLLAYRLETHQRLGQLEGARCDAQALVGSFPEHEYTWRLCLDLEVKTGHLEAAGKTIAAMSGIAAMKVERAPQGEAARRNLLRMRDLARERSAALVVMQYPLKDAGPLRELFAPADAVLVVSNRENFRQALARKPYEALFRDRFAGAWGHCVAEGNALIARALLGAMAEAGLAPDKIDGASGGTAAALAIPGQQGSYRPFTYLEF